MKKSNRFTRRGILQAAPAAAAAISLANAQEKRTGPQNAALEAQNPDSAHSPETDSGTVSPFKYSFALARTRFGSGGWTRQVTVRELPISKDIAGVEMRLKAGGVRELHWHVEAEWAIMLYGHARITAVDQQGRSFVSDVGEGDLWLFPKGVPHSIQGLGPDGCRFLLVFDDGNFNEFETFLITDWLTHTPKEVLAKNFNVPASTFDKVPNKELFIFQTELPGDLKAEQMQAQRGAGEIPRRYDFRTSDLKPAKVTAGGEVKIIDSKNFPVSPIAAAIVRVKPGGLRELHWHPNADEWQYYISGKGRMTVFAAGTHARTMDFQEGDVGYVLQSTPHYVENLGDTDLVFLEMFKADHYEDISLAEWMAHTPHQLVDQHLHTGRALLDSIPTQEIVITPL
jgi:oxalate decarboxylase